MNRRNVYLLICSLCVLGACSSTQSKTDAEQNEELTYSTYENEFYSFEYLSIWDVRENIRDKAEGCEEYEGNEKITLQQHEVDLINNAGLSFHVVKSNFHFDLPAKDYANASILTKGLASAGKYQDAIDEYRQNDPYEYLGYHHNDVLAEKIGDAILGSFKLK